MDLSNLKPIEGEVLTLLHPATGDDLTTDSGEPMTLTLLSADSDKYRSEIKRRLNAMSGKKQKLDLDEAERKGAELLARITTDCNLQMDGKPVKCTFENLVSIYMEYRWIKEQAEAFIGDRANFIKS